MSKLTHFVVYFQQHFLARLVASCVSSLCVYHLGILIVSGYALDKFS